MDELITTESKGPPLPKWAYGIVNPAMMALLRSPLHGMLSGAMMILIFEGRKSGKRYSIPVGYLEEGGKLYVFSHANWGKNFAGGAPVAVRLRGELRRGTARLVEDPRVILRFIRRMIDERGEDMAARMGFVERGADGVQRIGRPAGTRFVEITLE